MWTEKQEAEITSLLRMSARIGADPLLVQAGTGNTSIKLGDALWIKASGKWLSHAMADEMLVPVSLAEARRCVARNIDISDEYAGTAGAQLKPSIETAMHAVIPDRVVVHVHSVNTIAWAVQRDGEAQLSRLLAGLPWRWIPYVRSGNKLARAIARALLEYRHTKVFVLANHGLVVCEQSCESAEALLAEVERRVQVRPRVAPEPDLELMQALGAASGWRLPDSIEFHSLGADRLCFETIAGGVLYPCQAMFFGARIPAASNIASIKRALVSVGEPRPLFALLNGGGMLISRAMTGTEAAMLAGLVHVAQRIDGPGQVAYLTARDVRRINTGQAEGYRALMENACMGSPLSQSSNA